MKKIFLLFMFIILLTGCGSNVIEFSDLKIEKTKGLDLYYIVGTLNSKKENPFCEIDVIIKNGNIEYDYSFIELPDKGLNEVKAMIADDNLDKISNLEDYEVVVKKIQCE